MSAAAVLAQLQTLQLANLVGGGIEQYSLADGTTIRLTSATDIAKLIEEYERKAAEESQGSLCTRARLRER